MTLLEQLITQWQEQLALETDTKKYRLIMQTIVFLQGVQATRSELDKQRTTILGKNNEPLTDAEVDAYLAQVPKTDEAKLSRIRAKFEELKQQAGELDKKNG